MEPSNIRRLQQLVVKLEEGQAYEEVGLAVTLANSLKKWVAQEALFSRNEEINDVPTEHIPYLSLSYYHGVALMNEQDMDRRLEALKFAESSFEEYLNELKLYRALSEDVERGIKNCSNPSREELISRNKKKKELLLGLEVLQKREDTDSQRELYILQLELNAQSTLDHLKNIRREIPFLEMRAKGTKVERETEPTGPPTILRVDVKPI